MRALQQLKQGKARPVKVRVLRLISAVVLALFSVGFLWLTTEDRSSSPPPSDFKLKEVPSPILYSGRKASPQSDRVAATPLRTPKTTTQILDPPPIEIKLALKPIEREELTFFKTLRGKTTVALKPKKETDSKKQGIEQQKAKARPVKVSQKPTSRGGYTLQVASFPMVKDAETFSKRLREEGYDSYVSVGEVPKRGRWYRVRIGHYPDRITAQESGESIFADEQLDYIIIPDR